MDSTEPLDNGTPTAPLPSLPGRTMLTILSPVKLFEALRREPVVWGAVGLGALLVATGNLLIPTEIWDDAMRRQALEMGSDMPGAEGTAGRIAKVAAVAGAVVAWPLLTLILAGFYTLVFRVGMGHGGSYRQYLSVSSHALLIPAIGVLLLLPLRIHTGDPQLSLTLGLLVPVPEEGFVRTFLELQDIFNLWAYALVGAGAAVLGEREGVGSSVAAAVGAAVVISVLLAAVIF
jgi:hypothetical protein